MKQFLYGSLLIFLLFTIFIVILYKKNKKSIEFEKFEKNNSNVIFLTDKEVIDFFEKDPDNYVKNLSKIDLYARKVKTHNEYIKLICSSVKNFTQEQKDLLILSTAKADTYFKNIRYYRILGTDILKIKWKFGLTNHKYYEGGYPHTRNDIIFISTTIFNNDINEIISTLIHEKVHLYQRNNPLIMDNIVKDMGYEKIKISEDLLSYKRANPDINNNNYINTNNNRISLYIYNNEKPNSINDINIKSKDQEHPYETMAYEIANGYTKNYYIKLFSKHNF